MVVFEGGAPKKSDYRRFRIRGVERRLRRLRLDGRGALPAARPLRRESGKSPHDAELDESFAALPGLIMIDGGKGQLAAGVRALQPLVERGTTVISLAKRLEEVYVPGRSTPLPIRADSEASRLLQRVRDEAHRFALDLHRKRRVEGDDRLGARRAARGRARSASGRCSAISARRSASWTPPPRRSRRSRESPGKLARDIHRQLNKAG